ncbi:MAG: hypothetical protein A2146_08015 [Actinobacteria bacterium RBG_16_67_10]|nr:MAG: hypothetical protein A2146_08015 [Actinobacteria bacterium RBG_16_67_10]
MGAIQGLPRGTKEVLRSRFAAVNDTRWVLSLAAREGWEQANRAYLGAMRQRGAEEMAALMEGAGIGRPVSLDEACQLLEMALSFWASGTTVKRPTHRKGEAVLEIRVVNCPIYAQIEKTGWHGVTACGNWHRRRGWYQALGVVAEDTLLREKKWGYGACVARVKLRQEQRPC